MDGIVTILHLNPLIKDLDLSKHSSLTCKTCSVTPRYSTWTPVTARFLTHIQNDEQETNEHNFTFLMEVGCWVMKIKKMFKRRPGNLIAEEKLH